MQVEMCTNIFYEMVAVVQVLMKGDIQEDHQDLFLEQRKPFFLSFRQFVGFQILQVQWHVIACVSISIGL